MKHQFTNMLDALALERCHSPVLWGSADALPSKLYTFPCGLTVGQELADECYDIDQEAFYQARKAHVQHHEGHRPQRPQFGLYAIKSIHLEVLHTVCMCSDFE